LLSVTACGGDEPRAELPVVRVVLDGLAPGAFEPATEGVQIQSITPSNQPEGADMPALVLPPPGEARLVVPLEAVPCRLVTQVGVDQLVFAELSEAMPIVRVDFEVRAAERVLAREELELRHGGRSANAWRDLGGPAGIELLEPTTLTLRTVATGPDGGPFTGSKPLLAGFGGLRLERRFGLPRRTSSREEPNVVLIVMDTLRADRLATYGYARPTSPHLDSLARRGTRFDACYSTASWTWPATASLLTGLTPMEHRVVNEGASYLAEAATTLAEALQLAGCTTAAWSANPIVSPARNFDQGFEAFHPAGRDFRKTQEFFEEVRTFLRDHQDARFFLYLHLADPHVPLRPLAAGLQAVAPEVPPDFAPKSDRLWPATSKGQAVRAGGAIVYEGIATSAERVWTSQLYDAAVWSGDHWLGELLAELEALELADETVVAFTSDHGEELFERGFIGHGQSLKNELVRVPLVVAGPGVPAGRIDAIPVSSRFLAPLLARLAGADFAEGERALAVIRENRRFEPLVSFMTTKGSWKGRNLVHVDGLTDGSWKLELARNGAPWGAPTGVEGDWALFDLSSDTGEERDLAHSRPEELARLRSALDELLERQRGSRIGYDVPAGGSTKLLLDHLGYGGEH
jgi:arylsulfatase A-like enzyme